MVVKEVVMARVPILALVTVERVVHILVVDVLDHVRPVVLVPPVVTRSVAQVLAP